ncbi:transposase [Dictyobacter formicarum]|uniref:transposase n=1 Tax=Dictyobacter formicarum TaxID=2778368 RepID=UPI001915EE97|nr:transposase [Dictyobacter formicarum]
MMSMDCPPDRRWLVMDNVDHICLFDWHTGEVINIKFATKDCTPLSNETSLYDGSASNRNGSTQEHHHALQAGRKRQRDEAFWETYRARPGIEGTHSQGVRAFGMRRSRYRGMEKTHFQQLLCATAINVVRVLDWLDEKSIAKTRVSRFAALQFVA